MTKNPLACPSWCADHQEIDRHTPDYSVIHRSEGSEVGRFSVSLERFDIASRGVAGVVMVRLDDECLSVHQATVLASFLTTAAAQGGQGAEETVIRVLDLPVGRDFVVFKDSNVVGLSSRLSEDGRNRALAEAGLR